MMCDYNRMTSHAIVPTYLQYIDINDFYIKIITIDNCDHYTNIVVNIMPFQHWCVYCVHIRLKYWHNEIGACVLVVSKTSLPKEKFPH